MFWAGKCEVRTCRQAFARSPCSFASSWAAAIPEGGPKRGSPRAVLDSDPRGSKEPHQGSAQCGTMFGARVKSQPSCYLGGGGTPPLVLMISMAWSRLPAASNREAIIPRSSGLAGKASSAGAVMFPLARSLPAGFPSVSESCKTTRAGARG